MDQRNSFDAGFDSPMDHIEQKEQSDYNSKDSNNQKACADAINAINFLLNFVSTPCHQ